MRTPPRILVVDDNPENLEIFRARLASQGYMLFNDFSQSGAGQGCAEPPPGGGDPNSCQGFCGGQAPGGCFCDSACKRFGDCCAVKKAVCGGP